MENQLNSKLAHTDTMPIFPTMWQPVLTFGLPRDYLIIAVIICPWIWIICGQTGFSIAFNGLFELFFAFGIFWIVGWWKSRKDPEFFTIYLRKIQDCQATKYKSGKSNVYFP